MEKIFSNATEIKICFAAIWASFAGAWGLEEITDYQVDIVLKIIMCILGGIFTYYRIKLAIAQTNRENAQAEEVKKESAFNDKVRERADEAIIHEITERERDKIKAKHESDN